MEKIIECPFCDGHADLRVQEKEFLFKKEYFKVHEHYYKCGLCEEEFTTNEVDENTILQINNQYRSKHSIPFPNQIREIKLKYGLSSAKMSDVLGLGVNGYGNYEKGEMPTLAMGNLISTANNPSVFKSMIEKVKDGFSDGVYCELISRINFLVEKEDDVSSLKLNYFDEPNSFTGFKKLNKDKLSNVILAYISRCKDDFNDRLKLNKLLFYTDFFSYKRTCYSMTGLTYRAIQYGPVPSYYDNIYAVLENEGIIVSNWIKEENGSAKEVFSTEINFDSSVFDQKEIEIIDMIIDKFKDISTWDLVDLSHKEQSWIDLQSTKEIIDYQKYAFSLEAI